MFHFLLCKKRIFALCTASLLAVITLTTSVTASDKSAKGGTTAYGTLEGYVDKDVFSVELPTIPADTFQFIMDPQDLLLSDSSAYPGAAFSGETGLYFQTSTNIYTENSADVTIVNKSSVPVTLSISASVALSQEGISFTADPNFTDDAAPSVYLALTDGITPSPVDALARSVTMSATLDAVDESNFEFTYDPVEGYDYELKSGTPISAFKSFTFHMTGACNKNADWGNTKDITAEIDIIWSVERNPLP